MDAMPRPPPSLNQPYVPNLPQLLLLKPDYDKVAANLAKVRLKPFVQVRKPPVKVCNTRVPLDNPPKERPLHVVKRRNAVKPLPNVVVASKRLRP